MFTPAYDYKPGEKACRISGTLAVKRVTGAFLPNGLCFVFVFRADTWSLANLHITTLGHGYASFSHVDHKGRFILTLTIYMSPNSPGIVEMNLSHIITEFSFGPHFPDIVQPLDNSFEATDKSQFVL